MSSFPIVQVVEILIQDGPLSNGSNQFARILGIDPVTRKRIQNTHNLAKGNATDYYTELLEAWQGPLGNKATVQALRKILEDEKFKSAADSLEHLDVPELDKNQTTTTPALAAALSAYRLSDQTVRSKIVDILLIEPNLINEWVAFCGWLGIPEVELVQWRPQYMVAIMSKYELLSKILSVWGSREGGKANVAILIKVLNDHKFLTESTKIEDKFKLAE
ncbi:uncharacterized protein LOC110849824 [Folsomia candida]|uniref:Death domain-containing protein n=1 Tax=Folsomia candida TaxID=158441 RepID=A0A226E7F4_FOLCA|nr:uncharacterized protein LOC110849824 [Folsomia candida]OXA53359.1 hypothetical protein Fcan01_10320 [Folsomia candida]